MRDTIGDIVAAPGPDEPLQPIACAKVRTIATPVLVNARSYGESWASQPVLKRYQNRRMTDNFIMQSGMDLFYAGFSNNLQPLRIMRNLGLMAAERAGVLKRQALKYALGL